MRYFISPDATSCMAKSGPLPPPEGWTEVTLDEYRQAAGTVVPDLPELPVGGVQQTPSGSTGRVKSKTKSG